MAWYPLGHGDKPLINEPVFAELGGFITSPYVAIITNISGSDSPRLPILVGAVLTAVIGVIWSIYENIGLRIVFAKADEVNYSSSLDLNNVYLRIARD